MGLLSLKWEIMTDVLSFFFYFLKAMGGGKKGFSCLGILPRFLFKNPPLSFYK